MGEDGSIPDKPQHVHADQASTDLARTSVEPTHVLVSADDALRAIFASRTPKWTIAASLQLAQLLALLAAGCWGYYTYATFQRESNELSLRAARSQERQATFQLRQAELDVTKSTVEVQKLHQTPITTREEIDVTPLGGVGDSYLVRYHYSFTNNGNKTIVVGPVMAESFVARAPKRTVSAAWLVNDVGEPGPLSWEVVTRRGFLAGESWTVDSKVVNGPDSAPAERGGGGTGSLDVGETAESTIRLFVRGQPADFVGFRVRYSIDGGLTPSNRQRLRELRPLGYSDRREVGK